MNIRGVILDADGKAVGEHFKVTDVPANQVHFNLEFNFKKNQFFVIYNDFRDDVSSVYGVIIDDTGAAVKEEFLISNAAGHQVNPVAGHKPRRMIPILSTGRISGLRMAVTASPPLKRSIT